MKNNLSTVIITLNEEKNLPKCLESVKSLDGEIILVDSGSTDKTLEIARNYGAKIYFRNLDNFANQKNWGVTKAVGNWILAVDADEEIPVELAKEIGEAIKESRYKGYLIPRRNFILGKEIKYSRWSPDTHIWLWQKNSGKWFGDVHEEVQIKGDIGLLKNSKIHNSHKSVNEFIKANNLYSTLEARSLFEKNIRFSFWKMIWKACFEFCIRFFYKEGFLDGKYGFVLAYLMSVYKLSVWIKLWELYRKTR